MAAPKEIIELVERFDRNIDSYLSGQYNETQLRREFVDPFFKALGWDVDNEKGYAEAYKDVIHEDAIKVGGSTKAPDYCFRIGGARKFFVEAKKPSVNLKDDISPAFQLRRYSWSAKLPLGILTDFEELAVYDGRIQPVKTDRSSKARTMYLTYKEYVDRWDEIASIFSQDAVLKGSFDKYVESSKRKRGTAEVDAAFLKEIESWRDMLARNIALRNPDLSTRDLNFAVQRTIDRIIFLRICEDRGIEKYGWLQSLLEGSRVYPRLCEFFHRADERYNSGLFHFQDDPDRQEPADELTLGLEIDDKPLKDILRSLYYPDSPYEFSVLPAEILGHVYEQFLGKVISLTPGHRAKVEYKPEVRKAGGVYYTPSYIVDYIVENTVGKLLEGATPKTASELRVLDPACGSGSFLIGAYQRLLDWHRDWYVTTLVPLLESGKSAVSEDVMALLPGGYGVPKKGRGRGRPKKSESNSSQLPVFQAQGGEWKLTIEERRRILLNNIYGVDIDPQAVEVTKLSLHLKVLEGENEETLSKQLKLFQERALPDLRQNIKCGNSLIGPDFYDGQSTLLDEEEMYRVNAFDWGAEYPEIMDKGGFDAVIGNPPYIFARDEGFTNHEKQYFKKYNHYKYQINTFVLFTEQGFNLLQNRGFLGYIIPNNWLSISTMKHFRDFIVASTGDITIINNRFKVFLGASVDTSLLLFKKIEPTQICLAESYTPGEITPTATVNPEEILADAIIQFRLHKNPAARNLLNKIESESWALQKIAIVKAGLKAYETGKGNPPQTNEMKKNRVYHSKQKLDQNYRIYLNGKDVRRYSSTWSGEYLKYGPNLAAPRSPTLFEGRRILVRQIPSPPPYSINAMIVSGEELNDINSMIVKVKSRFSIKYIIGILNSCLLAFWFDYKFDKFQRVIFPQFKVNELSMFPIRPIDFSDPEDVIRHDQMVELVNRMLELNKKLAEANTGHEKTLLQRQIDATDRQIDRLVYELYDLTEEEVKIVEEASG
ncbi:MAG: TaqI-like C-terminal specificity domain-containing protein [Euryarchaeota archaeon]|nr:TaqI-like C-terminal specificity domain-containing protein [Euryarchaeota archaeon]